MYEKITYEVILQRMLDRIPNDFDKREGSVIYDALAPAAIELQLLYIELDTIINEAFVDTATREYLIRRATEIGLLPHPATNAILQGEFTPANLDVPIGTRFNLNKLNYIVIEKVSNGVYKVMCETPGILGNQYLGDLTPIDYINGLETAKLTAVLIFGENEEDTEHLRTRILEKGKEEEGYGNIADYIRWAKEVPGVGNVMVEPLWQGEGTIKVVILDADGRDASTETINAVQKYIDPGRRGIGEGKAPIGARVTVVTALSLKVSVKIPGLSIEPGYTLEQVKMNVGKALRAYLNSINPGGVIRIKEAETAIIQAQGVEDIGDILLDGARNNIVLTINELADLGSVNYVAR